MKLSKSPDLREVIDGLHKLAADSRASARRTTLPEPLVARAVAYEHAARLVQAILDGGDDDKTEFARGWLTAAASLAGLIGFEASVEVLLQAECVTSVDDLRAVGLEDHDIDHLRSYLEKD